MLQLEGELYNGRVAMLAVVGILTVEALGRGPWWQAYNTVSVSELHVSKKCVLFAGNSASDLSNHFSSSSIINVCFCTE